MDKPRGYPFQILPRIGAIYRVSEEIGLRASAGMGYKAATIFSDQSDPCAIYQILPSGGDIVPEKSVGGEFDITYNAVLFDELSLDIDRALFFARVKNPFILQTQTISPQQFFSMSNAGGYLSSWGAETDIKLTYADMQVNIGYTYTDCEG